MTDSELSIALKELRVQLARQKMLEPYMIFPNRVIEEIVLQKPTSLEQLGSIKGIGEKKLSQFGNLILALVTANTSLRDQNFLDSHMENMNDEAIALKNEEKIYSVSEFIETFNYVLYQQFPSVIIQGEISKISERGNYIYFTVLDKTGAASLHCMIHTRLLHSTGFVFHDGLEVKILGYPNVYALYGKLTFMIEEIFLVGDGALRIAFEKMKQRLESLGYFAQERKRSIPRFPLQIGVITSTKGAAIHDFQRNLASFGIKVHVYDVRVEGVYAVSQVVKAIKWFNNTLPTVDALVLIRGGGSLESLQAYNSEAVAKAIFSSRIPILTGVGHENDFTIADFVADFRTSTPTAAAKYLCEGWLEVQGILQSYEQGLERVFKNCCNKKNKQLLTVLHQLAQRFSTIENLLSNKEISMKKEAYYWYEGIGKKVDHFEEKLNLLDPEKKLKQGYSIVLNQAGSVVKSTEKLHIGDLLDITLFHGKLAVTVEKKGE